MSEQPRFGFVIRYVPDIDAATRFYTEVLGMRAERHHPTYVQFEHFALASDESLGGGRDPELYWLVDDAEANSSDLSRRAEITMPLTEKPFGKVFGIRDPAGQPCYLLEFSKDRPSQPTG